MQKTTTEIEPYIDRSYYDKKLESLMLLYDPVQLVGQRNPYTGKLIRTPQEGAQYLQQRALSETYRSAANTALSALRTESSARINELEARVRDLEKKKQRHPLLAVLLLCAAFFAGSQIRGTEQDRSTVASASSAYSYVSATATPRPTARATAAPKPAATATPRTNSAAYRTTPISGYSLTMTVYVSNSGGKIHLSSNCSGMKYYTEMTYGEACERGYTHCSKCF